MFSDSDYFLSFYGGITLRKDRHINDFAKVQNNLYQYPIDIGYARIDIEEAGNQVLYIGGGNDKNFHATHMEIWSLE